MRVPLLNRQVAQIDGLFFIILVLWRLVKGKFSGGYILIIGRDGRKLSWREENISTLEFPLSIHYNNMLQTILPVGIS